jgi:adenine-specific DNA methylase
MVISAVRALDDAKARGGFYTPEGVTRFMADWAVDSTDAGVLEPSCGDGAFLSAVIARFRQLGSRSGQRIMGIERDATEADKARHVAPQADIRTVDFFDLDPATTSPVDVVIGNPPYIRYHGFSGADRRKALDRARAQGVELSGLASSWAHFVAHATAFLKPSGRLALVLPAELLHTDYGEPIRAFLLRRFRSITVVAFDRMVFAEAQVDAVIMLASQNGPPGLRILRVKDDQSLAGLEIGPTNDHDETSPRRWSAAVDLDAGRAYSNALSSLEHRRLGEIASVDIGFVSGANAFFVLSAEEAQSRRIPAEVLTPAIRRPGDVDGILVRPGDLQWLLDLGGRANLDPAVAAYLAYGQAQGVHERYKCRVRKSWFAVPLPRHRADAFIPYMTHLGPRLIVNEAGARSSNLLHGVSLRQDAPPARALAVAMLSSLTLLSAEVEGRAYGGGVLKLETREAERLAIPSLDSQNVATLLELFDDADSLVRAGALNDASRLVDEALEIDHEPLLDAARSFRARRLGRRRHSVVTGLGV